MSEPARELETPEAMERALNLVAARRSGSEEAYREKLGLTTAAVSADEWETARTLHALARIGSTAIRLYASSSGVPAARAFQMVAEALQEDDEPEDAGEASNADENH